MLFFKDLQENQRVFLIIYTLLAISVISVFRHGTTLLYLILWVYLFIIQKQSLNTLKIAAGFAKQPPMLFLSLLMGFGVLSTIWSIHPLETLAQSITNFLTFASFAVFFAVLIKQNVLSSKAMRICLIIIFTASFLLLMLQAIGEQTIRFYLHHSNRGLKPNAEVLAILAIPLIAAFLYQKRYGWGVLFYILSLLLTYIVEIRTSFIALVVGGILAICYYVLPRLLVWSTTVVSVVYTLAFPWVVSFIEFVLQHSAIPDSFIHRLHIWNFVADKIKEKPWFGWGVNISHHFPGGNQSAAKFSNMTLLPSHPHNEVMQIWLEQGLFGAVLLACFHGSLFFQLRKESNRLVMSMYGFYLTSVFIMLQMSHSAWHKWWICWMALCGGLLMAFSKNVSRHSYSLSGDSNFLIKS